MGPSLLKQNDDFALHRVQSLEFIQEHTSSIDSSIAPGSSIQAGRASFQENQGPEPTHVPPDPIQVPLEPPPSPAPPPPSPPPAQSHSPSSVDLKSTGKNHDIPKDDPDLPVDGLMLQDSGWIEFRLNCAKALKTTSVDEKIAYKYWQKLNMAERLLAVTGVKRRKPPTDPDMRTRISEYLRLRKWEENQPDPVSILAKPKERPMTYDELREWKKKHWVYHNPMVESVARAIAEEEAFRAKAY